MKKILLLFLTITLFSSCSEDTDDSKLVPGTTYMRLCRNMNNYFIEKVKELEICKDDGCGVQEHENWLNENNYCETKYQNDTFTYFRSYHDCVMSLLKGKAYYCNEIGSCHFDTLITKEEIQSFFKKEIETLHPTCSAMFEKNLLDRCEFEREAYFKTYQVQCDLTDEELRDKLNSTENICESVTTDTDCDNSIAKRHVMEFVSSNCEYFSSDDSTWLNKKGYKCLDIGSDDYECFMDEFEEFEESCYPIKN
ncbi:hypothetical protein JXR93_04940 [bacterium]|nr:hypothetical protein [bacterium]